MTPPISRFCLISIAALVLNLAGVACSSDDDVPDPTVGAGGGGTVSSSSGGGGGGGSVENDVGSDAGEDADIFRCDLEPSDLPGDPMRPCCFDDHDCWESDVPQAEEMYCYHADCGAGYQGVCRVPPELEDECWDLWDCPEGEVCPYEFDPDNLDCERDTRNFPDLCIEE